MKTIFKYSLFLFAMTIILSACKRNEPAYLEDSFIGAEGTSFVVNENATEATEIPVYAAGKDGGATTVEFSLIVREGVANPAVEGVDFNILNTSTTLNFGSNNTYDYIQVEPIDNDVYDKDKYFSIVLSAPGGQYILGSSDTIDVIISDNEHPLALVIGSYSAAAVSYFNGSEVYTITTAPDPNDDTHLFISNLVAGGTNLVVFGVVDLNAMTIEIPVSQAIVTSAANPAILSGFYGPDGAVGIPDGGVITGDIDVDGNITIQDEYGSEISEGSNAGFWYNIYMSGAVWTKTAKKSKPINSIVSTPKILKK